MSQSILSTLFLFILFAQCNPKESDHDILILNGVVYDGSGNEPSRVDIGPRQDQIVAIGDLTSASSTRTIDATDLAISPGFIDMHTHLEPLMEMPLAESLVRQGVTFT